MRNLLFIGMALILGFSSNVTYAASSCAGTITLTVDMSAQPQGQDAKLWIPYPVSDSHQRISDIKVSGDYSASGVYTDRSYGTPILYAEWPKDAASRKLTFSFAVERQDDHAMKEWTLS